MYSNVPTVSSSKLNLVYPVAIKLSNCCFSWSQVLNSCFQSRNLATQKKNKGRRSFIKCKSLQWERQKAFYSSPIAKIYKEIKRGNFGSYRGSTDLNLVQYICIKSIKYCGQVEKSAKAQSSRSHVKAVETWSHLDSQKQSRALRG